MRIAYVGSTIGHDRSEHHRRERISNELVDASVVHLTPEHGPESVESGVEASFGAVAILDLIRSHRDDFDAFFIGCFGEPGLEAARELTEKPVIGSATASFHFGAQLADRVSCITVLPSAIPLIRRRIDQHSLGKIVTDVRSIDTPIHDINPEDDSLVEAMVEAGFESVEEAESGAIVPGCMTLSYMRANDRIAERLGVPVIDPVAIGLGTTVMTVRHGVSQSRYAYPEPQSSSMKHHADL